MQTNIICHFTLFCCFFVYHSVCILYYTCMFRLFDISQRPSGVAPRYYPGMTQHVVVETDRQVRVVLWRAHARVVLLLCRTYR